MMHINLVDEQLKFKLFDVNYVLKILFLFQHRKVNYAKYIQRTD